MSIWDWLLNPAGLTAHGFCLSWAPGLIALHVISDALTGLAYFSMPLVLMAFARRRPDLKYIWVLYLFVVFIFACGADHLMSIVTLWLPAYGIEGIVKLITAILSVAVAITLWPLLPKFVALPSPATLERLNGQLQGKIVEQQQTAALLHDSEARVKAANSQLQRRVEAQTSELRAANAQLTLTLEQRDILLREVYHRVKNNLQIVDALLAAQARQISDKAALAALLYLRQRVYAMGLVHQQLMESADLKTFDIAPFLQELTKTIMEASSSKGVALSVNSIPLAVGLDFAIPLGLLVTELLTNALKHEFAEGSGLIAVTLERGEAETLTLTVSDDGLAAEGVKTTPFPAKPGHGINMITGLVAQMKGKVALQDGARTEIYLALPAAP